MSEGNEEPEYEEEVVFTEGGHMPDHFRGATPPRHKSLCSDPTAAPRFKITLGAIFLCAFLWPLKRASAGRTARTRTPSTSLTSEGLSPGEQNPSDKCPARLSGENFRVTFDRIRRLR